MNGKEVKLLLCNNIKRYRKREKLSQVKLAEKIGVSANYLSNIECCKAWVSPDILAKLATVFKIEIHELFKSDLFMSNEEKDDIQSYIDENTKAVLRLINVINGK